MTDFYISLAGQLIHIQSIHSSVKHLCEEYTVKMDMNCEKTKIIDIVTNPDDIQHENNIIKSTDYDNKEIAYSDGYLETLAVYRKIAEQLIKKNILLFHGSVIAVDGIGYLFTARSGTGKSTHTRLWREVFGNRAVMVNDDKPLISINGSEVWVHGTPWDGKHHLSNRVCVPLKAICSLKRRNTLVEKNMPDNIIRNISGQESYQVLLQSVYRSQDKSNMMQQLSMFDKLLENVSIYELYCNMEKEAAIVAYNGMQNEKERKNET